MIGLRSENAAMVFEIQFIVPGRQADHTGRGRRQLGCAAGNRLVIPDRRMRRIQLPFNVGKISLRHTEKSLGINHLGVGPAYSGVEHGARRAAAVIANPKKMHHFGQARVAFARLG